MQSRKDNETSNKIRAKNEALFNLGGSKTNTWSLGQSAKTADWLENNDVKWLFSRNYACANSKDSKWSKWRIIITLAFVKFCGKLDDSYPGCQRNFFSRSERTLSDSKSTVEDTRLITSQVCMSSSNASSCIILLVLATVNFLDMGCWFAPRLFKNLTETSELATKFFFVLGNYRSNLVLMDERFLLLKISSAGRCYWGL